MKETTNFNGIAFAYDFLARMVFGNRIATSQTEFLNRIPSASKVLIIGGGTGWIINELFQRADITRLIYVETSEKMLKMSKSKTKQEYLDRVDFVFGTEENINESEKVDVVITFFLLDLFSKEEQKLLCQKLLKHLNPRGLWLVSDFDYNMDLWWQKVLIKIMYIGFRIISNVKASALTDTKSVFKDAGLNLSEEKFYFKKMIFSRLYYC